MTAINLSEPEFLQAKTYHFRGHECYKLGESARKPIQTWTRARLTCALATHNL